MSEIAAIIDELKNIHDGDAWHGPSLKENLAGISATQAAAKPIAGGHSIWELVSHIAGWENVFLLRLDGQVVNEPEEGDFPPAKEIGESAWQAALQRLDGVHEKLLARISALSDDQLNETVIGKDYTVRYLLRGLVRHHVYHAGQIGLLKRV
jgi:uncharacterized damage-inducible protein DinB